MNKKGSLLFVGIALLIILVLIFGVMALHSYTKRQWFMNGVCSQREDGTYLISGCDLGYINNCSGNGTDWIICSNKKFEGFG